jgi:hypothetical protein
MVASNIADISIGVQTAKGTAAATALIRTPIVTNTLRPERTVNRVEETGATRMGGPAYVAQSRVAGEVSFRVRPENIVPFLWGALGTLATTGASDPRTHTATLATTQPYLTVWTTLGTSFAQLVDCKVTSLAFASDSAGLLTATVGMVGLTAKHQTAAETTQTYESSIPFVHHEAQGQFLIESVAASSITAARINIGTGVDTLQGDAIVPDLVSEGALDIVFETEQIVADFALWNRYHYGTASPANNALPTRNIIELGATGLDFKWSKRDSVGAVATPERSLQFTATRVQIEDITGQEPTVGGEPLTRTVRYRVADPGSGSSLTAVAKNARATYTAS